MGLHNTDYTTEIVFLLLTWEQYVLLTILFYRENKADFLSLLLNAIAHLGVCFRTSLFNEK